MCVCVCVLDTLYTYIHIIYIYTYKFGSQLMGSGCQEVACALAALGQCHANLGNDRTHKDEGMSNVVCFGQWVGFNRKSWKIYSETIGFPWFSHPIWGVSGEDFAWNILKPISWFRSLCRSQGLGTTCPCHWREDAAWSKTCAAWALASRHVATWAAWGLGQNTGSWLQPWWPAGTATSTALHCTVLHCSLKHVEKKHVSFITRNGKWREGGMRGWMDSLINWVTDWVGWVSDRLLDRHMNVRIVMYCIWMDEWILSTSCIYRRVIYLIIFISSSINTYPNTDVRS